MAQFDESKIINALHSEKAEIGKRYWFSDNIIRLRSHVEQDNKINTGTLIKVKEVDGVFQIEDISGYNVYYLIYPYEEPSKQRMTNIQLMEWLCKGNGIYKYRDSSYPYYHYACGESVLNQQVADPVVIRAWDSDKWIEPTVDIYERDCKEGKK